MAALWRSSRCALRSCVSAHYQSSALRPSSLFVKDQRAIHNESRSFKDHMTSPKTKTFCTLQPHRFYCATQNADLADRILSCIKQYDKLMAAEVKLDSRFKEDLSMDSLDHVEMIMMVEDEFGFEIPDAIAEKMDTPAKILDYVVEKGV